MNTLKSILLSITILTFLLPFIPSSCSKFNSSKPVEESFSDSCVVEEELVDPKAEIKDNILSNTDSVKRDEISIFQRVFILPDKTNLSGLGYLLLYFDYEYFLIFFAFSFLIIGFLIHVLGLPILFLTISGFYY